MGEQGRFRRDQDSPTKADGGAAVRSPSSAPGSSSSDLPPPSDAPTLVPEGSGSDAPTRLPLPRLSPSETPTLADGASPAPRSGAATRGWRTPPPVLETGAILAGRYEIQQILGEGGMGAVYKAKDLELDRMVALKVIRPELAKNPAIIDRFKQELRLSQRVTHRNVIRIYDLGEGDGVKFITMEYIEGRDLRSLIHERKKFSPEEAVEIMEQICLALDAAHGVDVIHRDLKPQNVMRDSAGRILVMDFGLARTLEGDGMTQTGALVGTMEYMSPEQALAKELDQRSDLFSAGLIFYELLTGQMPYRADSALASLIRRTQERAVSIHDFDRNIPDALSYIVSRCLERDPATRYQSAAELLAHLQAWQGKRTAGAIAFQSVRPWGQTVPWPKIGGIAAVLVLAVSGYVWRDKLISHSNKKTVVAGPSVSLAIIPFRNASGDPRLDWLGPSLAEMLTTDVGQSTRLRSVSQDRLHQILSDQRIAPNASLEQATLRRLADFSNSDTLVWGQFLKFGDQIRIDATLQDLKHDRTVPIKIEAASEKDIPGAVDRLAASIRNSLSFSSDVIKELKASSFQPDSRSVPALRDYNQGVQLLREGKNLQAVQAFDSARKEDPSFTLAYSRLAEADSALGYDSDAEQASQKAMELSESLPLTEKYVIQAAHARIMKDNPKAIEAYENLARSMPDDSDVELTLASLYTDTGAYDNARAQLSKLLDTNPKNAKALWQKGVVEIMNDNPQAALEPLNQAFSLAVQTDNQELKALTLQAMGLSYQGMNKPDDAMSSYQDAMAINRRLGLKRNLAGNLLQMAIVHNNQGKTDIALDNYKQALRLQREIGMKKEVGDTLNDMGALYQSMGNYNQALQNYKDSLQIQRDAGDENYQALCLNNIGGVYLATGDTDNALTYFQQALHLRDKLKVPGDIADTLASLGQAYTTTGKYDEALASFMRALDLRRQGRDARGAAEESHQMGLVFQYQGRFGAAVTSMEDSVKGYREVGDRSGDMAELLNNFASALAQAGRGAESDPLLKEAQTMAQNLKNEGIQAAILSTQGDVQRYRGDWSAAKGYYDQAERMASRGTDPERRLISKLHLAEVGLAQGQLQSAMRDFRQLAQQADGHNLKYLSLLCSVDLADAMISAKDYPHAQQELEKALGRSDKLGTRFLSARIHYLLGSALRRNGNGTDAASHYRQAISRIDDMSKEPGAEKLTERLDIRDLYAESTRWAAPAKN
jgi:serine/threonine protein kinase/Tfp pilus assembly protein PilF